MSEPDWRRLARAEARLAGDAAPVAGVDEVGRGPLAGPVVAAAVILEHGGRWEGLDDSKQVNPELRLCLYARLLTETRAFAWAVLGPRAIDRLNIRRASLEVMRRSIGRLRVQPALVLVDGRDPVPGLRCTQQAVIDGDARLLSVAAASVMAKVVRDRIMERLDRVWPAYGFARHKGYATAEHLEALRRHGPCPIHRYSFEPIGQTELLFEPLPSASLAP
ncbi:MAG: ribonuclease HII [Candidatus Eisenbacteria bacterium]|uniref:Ribonuclease HII n=1 Tax=Eiseniibacteriota bacterium TaxID=2212470 RepID=A0A538TMK9_UNCEI|nr:MAG: ribonuclease HII [Candidatus Eisenbacteria bacterium]